MKKLLITAALLATACTPSQSQQPLQHKFVTECRTTSFYGTVTTKCYEVDVTQRWLDYQVQQHPLPREGDSPELRAAKEAAAASLHHQQARLHF
jgi:hypothetical protein